MQKSRKILRDISEKTALPTNQPTNQPSKQWMVIWRPFHKYLQINFFFLSKIRLCDFSTFIVPKLHAKHEKILRAISEKTALPTNQPSNANLETFWRISPNQYFFFKNRALQLFYLYSPLTSCKKSEKCLELFLRKLCYQTTNQPITNNTNFIGPGWHRSNKWKNPS